MDRGGLLGFGVLKSRHIEPEDLRADISNWRSVHPAVVEEMPGIIRRARQSGARGPLEYVGAGMFNLVLCDASETAWIIARFREPLDPERRIRLQERIEEEFEYLQDAFRTALLHPNVVRAIRADIPNLVLVRECVRGRPGTWGESRILSDLLKRIEDLTLPRGWTAPEFKEDSFIIRPNGIPVLVDVSLVQRVGENLARFVEDVLAGRRVSANTWRDFAFFVWREGHSGPAKWGLTEARARELLARLGERDPTVRRDFPPDRPL